MNRGWQIGTKSWDNRKNSFDEVKRLVSDLRVSSKNGAHPVSFKAHALYIVPAISSGSERTDRANAKVWLMKTHNVNENFFQVNVLHHDLDGTMMYVDKKLHNSKRHLGYFFHLKQIQKQKLGI